MAVPKSKVSKQRRDKRRANWKLAAPAVTTCPKCGAALIKRKTKRGKVFYGCEKYPECDFVSWDMPSGENCPKCGAIMVNKVGPRGKYVACSNKDCGYIERSVKKGTENDVEK